MLTLFNYKGINSAFIVILCYFTVPPIVQNECLFLLSSKEPISLFLSCKIVEKPSLLNRPYSLMKKTYFEITVQSYG